MLHTNGREIIDDEIPTQMVNAGFGFRPASGVAYIDIPFWGTLRFWRHKDGHFSCDGPVPWAGF